MRFLKYLNILLSNKLELVKSLINLIKQYKIEKIKINQNKTIQIKDKK